MKKLLVILSVVIVVILGIMFLIPVLFKDEIKATIDEQLEATVNANVIFELDKFSVSLFKNFPNFTASIEEFGITGRNKFEGETLFTVKEMNVEINIGKLIFGDKISVQSIDLADPEIFIKVLEDGSANYDIYITDEEAVETDTSQTDDFTFAIENWSVTNGHIIYDDATIPFFVELKSVEHSGSGDFTLSIFDLDTYTEGFLTRMSYDGDSYLENKNINLDMILNMDIDNFKFTFKENDARINDFAFGFDGWLSMPSNDIDMDITFSTHDNTFKSLISLLPSMYSEDFSELKASGTLAFDGYVKGTYSEASMPAYKVNLVVEEGMFQYPDLPEAVSNVNVNMLVESKDGDIDNTMIDISKFHIDFGQEPFDGYLKIANLVNYPVDMQLKTTLNLANLNKLFPVEGLNMKGIFKADFKAEGVYDSVKSEFPRIDATMQLEDAQIKYVDLPAPLSNINITSLIKNETGLLNDTELNVSAFDMVLDGTPIKGSLLVDNFDDYHWDLSLEGNINFNKLFPIINKLYEMPGTKMGGNIEAHFKTAGKMSDVDNERYDRISNSGSFTFNNFNYSDSVYLPQGMNINSGSFTFNPKQMNVNSMQLNVGKSDFRADGNIRNYIKYIFNEDETIFGNLAILSNKVDLNEWMTEEDDDEEEIEEGTEAYSVIEVPGNIDFVMQAEINQIIYDNLVLKDAKGQIIVRNGVVNLSDLATSTLGGRIVFNGTYDTRDMDQPSFDMGLDVSNIEIKQSYTTFNTIQALAPIASNIDGNATSNFSLSGILKQDMMPDFGTINGSGLIKVLNAQFSNSKLVTGLTSNFKGGDKDNLALKDIIMNVSIEDGKLSVKPFDLKINNYTANVGGNTSLDGQLNYNIKMDVPAGNLGSKANELIGSLTGNQNQSDVIKLNLGIGGTYDDPKVNLLGTDAKEIAKQAVADKTADAIKEKTGVEIPTSKEEVNKEAVAKAREEADKILAEAQVKADQVKDEAKKAADKLRAEAKVQNDKLIKEAGSNILKKRAAEIAGKKLMDEAEKKATRLEAEGKKRADAIMATAKEKADTIIKNAESK